MPVLLWLCVIWPPIVLYCPLKEIPPEFGTAMVIERLVIGAVLANLRP